MKKIISILLLAAMCLGLLAGCGETAANTGLEDAKKFVHSSYISASANTPVDYKVMGVTRVDGVEYQIEWTANSDKISFVRGEDKFVTVKVPTDNLEDVKYVLTGTISDANGNKVTVTFDRVVPARAGVPTDVATGTYVITWDNLTFSSLTADKNYGYAPYNTVTVADGAVSGHFKADVLTLTAVDGGFTIQDAHGRYVYLKGTYNSFNVSAEAPEDGHIWQLLSGKDGSFIVNKMNGKTLCYDSQFSSWGAYDEVTEARKSQITVTAATAPEVDPEKPVDPETPDTPSQPSGEITTPVAGTAYKLGMFQGSKNVMLYFTGLINQASTPWYMQSTENVAGAIDVFVEEVDGGLLLYFTIEGTKTYLDMHKDGTHYSLQLTTEPVSVYTWNAEHNTFVAMVDDKECFIGTSGTYNTFSCNTMDKIDSSFVAHLYPQTGATTPSEPEQPEQPADGIVATPAVNTAYKFGMVQPNAGNKTYYLTGAMSSFYMATTEDITAGVDVYLEATEGGYYLYAMVGETKQYINMVVTTGTDGKTHVNGAFEATASTVYTWDAEHKTVVANITVGDKTEPYWHGTRNDKNYTTVGPCAVSYAGFFCQFYVQGGASTPETPSQPTGETLTIEQAIAMGAAKEHNTYTEEKYYVTGEITEVYNTQYGNMKIKDANGNILTVYGTYSADGSTRYDAMTVKPVAGDTVTVYGIIGQYNGTPQMKNGWITEHKAAEGTTPSEPEKPAEPETPATDADAIISFADASSRTEMSADKQVWSANGVTVTNDKAASTSDVKDYVGPVRFYAKTSLTIAYTGMKTIKITCNRDSDVTNLVDSLAAVSGITVSSEGKVVTVTFAAASDVLVIDTLVAQVRVDKIEVYK